MEEWRRKVQTTAHEEEESKEYLWKACVVLAGIYLFYLLELFLHGLTDYLKKVCNSTCPLYITLHALCIFFCNRKMTVLKLAMR